MIRIIGIDPGLQRTGWGVIESSGNFLQFIASGTVRSDRNLELANRLLQLYKGLNQAISKYMPDQAAVENTFVNKDAKATLKLGQARGISLLVPALLGLTVAEYAPNTVKKAVIGRGHGDKQQIVRMINIILPKARYDSEDATDALAIAVCHAHHRKASSIICKY